MPNTNKSELKGIGTVVAIGTAIIVSYALFVRFVILKGK